MVDWTYAESLKRLLAHEGGYSNDAHDPGGPTNFGITIFDYRKYVKPGATAADVRAMQLGEATRIYDAKYWHAQACQLLPAGVDDSVFDYGVNSGIGRSGKVLRRVLGMAADTSVVTDAVIAEVAKRDPKAIIVAINDERLRFLQGLRTWPNFGKGWGRRVAEVKAYSLALAAQAHAYPTSTPTPVPAPDVAPANGKGHVPAPTGTKSIIKSAGGGGVLGGMTFAQWIAAHPIEAELATLGGIVVIGGALYAANRWHQAKQEAPTPGLVPVPAIAA